MEIDNNASQQSLHLPVEIIEEILPRLGVKSLLRFRCVSKSWRSLIDRDTFIETHHQNSTRNPCFPQQRVILHNLRHRPMQCSLQSLLKKPSVEKPSALDDPNNVSLKLLKVVGCYNGLVCILEEPLNFFLWNPSTRVIKKLPEIACRGCTWNYGFGRVESSGEYKVFALVNCFLMYDVNVYSSKTKSWKRIERLESRFGSCAEGVFLDGKLHWYSIDNNNVVTFDLKKEVFGNITAPVDLECFKLNKCLGVVGGCLCMLSNYHRIWIMKEYGARDYSWERVAEISHVLELLERPFSAPFTVGPKGEILLFCGSTFLIYCPRDNVFCCPKIFCHYESHHLYVESLVSPERL